MEVAVAVVEQSEPQGVRVDARAQLPAVLARLGLDEARAVVVLVGGAAGLDEIDRNRLRPLFERGLVPVVDAIGACIADGGTEAGVMAMIGDARAAYGGTFPLIGVAAADTVEADTDGAALQGAPPLDPHHTHVLLVPGTRWGDESPWLSDVATQLAGDSPSLTVVVNGGDVTFDDVARSIDAGRPVLVVAGSGRTADALAHALEHGSDEPRVAGLVASGMVQAVDVRDGPRVLAKAIATMLTTERVASPAAASYQEWLRADFDALIEQLHVSRLQARFLRSRWLDQLLWVEGRANHNRDRYYFWRLLTIVGGVIVPALVTLDLAGQAAMGFRWATFAVSLLVAISAAVEGFFRYGERWRHYRRTAELLKTEGWQFFQLTGNYRAYNAHAPAYRLFASRVEDIMQQDVDAYITTVAAEPSGEQANRPGENGS